MPASGPLLQNAVVAKANVRMRLISRYFLMVNILNFIFSLSRLSCTNVIYVVLVKEILKLDTNPG